MTDKHPPTCPYCGNQSKLVGGDVIYPHRPDLKHKKFYLCKPCKAYVGCHPGGAKPLGRLADARLRRAKSMAHRHFDVLWKKNTNKQRRRKKMDRREAYCWLAEQLDIPREHCHIGMFDIETCQRVVDLCRPYIKA